jgi:hypothetical protein
MALLETNYTDNDVTFPDVSTIAQVCKSFFLQVKKLMAGQVSGTNGPDGAPPVGSRWTVVSSSNGTTSGASDNWSTVADIVQAAAGVAHSWVVLQSPTALDGGTAWQVCIDLSSATTTQCIIAIAKTAFTGGSTTARPTSVDEVASVVAQTTLTTVTALGTHRLSRVTTAGGAFHILHITAGSGTGFHTIFGVKKLVGAGTTDAHKVGFFFESVATTRGSGGIVMGSGLYNISTGNGGWLQRSADGTASAPDTGRGSGIVCPYANSSGVSYYLSSTGADGGTGKFYGFPAKVWTSHSTSARVAERGTLPDIYIGNAGPAVGTAQPLTGTPERVYVGNWWVPCGGILPLL